MLPCKTRRIDQCCIKRLYTRVQWHRLAHHNSVQIHAGMRSSRRRPCVAGQGTRRAATLFNAVNVILQFAAF